MLLRRTSATDTIRIKPKPFYRSEWSKPRLRFSQSFSFSYSFFLQIFAANHADETRLESQPLYSPPILCFFRCLL